MGARSQPGYKTISPVQIGNGLAAYDQGFVRFSALRVYLAAFELQAIREAAQRSRKKAGKKGRAATFYREEEVQRLVGSCSERILRRDLRALERAGLVRLRGGELSITETELPFARERIEELSGSRSKTRPIPVPRAQLLALAACSKPAFLKVFLGYYLRGLSLDRQTGEICSRGTAKVSWLSEVLQLSDRAVKVARAELIRVGVIAKDESSFQRKLNRDGAWFELDVAWRPECTESAPPLPSECTESAPPKEILETPYRTKDQRTRRTERPGVFPRVSIRNVTLENLSHLTQMEELFFQAGDAGWLEATEANALNFLAASVRARHVEDGDAVRIFLGLVRRGLWSNVTHDQEDEARRALKRFREKRPLAFRQRQSEPPRAGQGVREEVSGASDSQVSPDVISLHRALVQRLAS